MTDTVWIKRDQLLALLERQQRSAVPRMVRAACIGFGCAQAVTGFVYVNDGRPVAAFVSCGLIVVASVVGFAAHFRARAA